VSIWEGLEPPYSTIVADPPWHYDERLIEYGKAAPMPYSTMSDDEIARLPVMDLAAANAHLYLWTTQRHLWVARDVCLGWGFEPSQLLVWCKPPAGMTPGGAYASSAEFVIYARRSHGGGVRLVQRAGRAIAEAREAAGLTRAQLHRLVREGEPTGIVYRWEADDCLPSAADWDALVAALPALEADRPDVVPSHMAERMDRCWWEWPRGRHSEKPAAFLDIVERVSPGPYVELFARAPRLGWDSWGKGYEAAS
jgi:N6-adenosine-specific RNA methylase IME4